MSGIELAFGVIGLTGALDVCFRYGKSFIETCRAVAEADKRLQESSLRIEAIWFRIEVQLQVVGALGAELDERHRQIQNRTVEVLLAKLKVADSKLAGLIKPSDSAASPDASRLKATIHPRRWKYGLARDGLRAAIADLEDWLRLADISWFFMIRFTGPPVDRQLDVTARQQETSSSRPSADVSAPSIDMARQLRRATKSTGSVSKESVLLGPDGLNLDSLSPVPLSPAINARRLSNNETFLLNPVTSLSKVHAGLVLKDARNFAWKLKNSNPFLLGLLDCKGVLKDDEGLVATRQSDIDEAAPGLFFVFRLPPSVKHVESVRNRLLKGPGSEHESLSGRFDLARHLVRAVSSVHLYDFVHKNVRPETILVLGSESANIADTAVLVGFDVIRNADGRTYHLGDDYWEKNLYRHPSRQGRTPEAYYEMRHDIYSVGVCLLEIGLWESFVSYKGDSAVVPDGLASELGIGDCIEAGSELLKDPNLLKRGLVRLTRGRLRKKMGTRYSRVVETCLTCLDGDNEDFGDEEEFQDDDGVAVGVRYIEKVVEQLADISV